MNDHAGGLVQNRQVAVFVENLEGNFLSVDTGKRYGRHFQSDCGALLDAMRGLHRAAVDENAPFFHQQLNVRPAHVRELRCKKPIEALARLFGVDDKDGVVDGSFHGRKWLEADSKETASAHLLRSVQDIVRTGVAGASGAAPRRPRHHRNRPVSIIPMLTICIRETLSWKSNVRPGSPRKNSMTPRSNPYNSMYVPRICPRNFWREPIQIKMKRLIVSTPAS